MTPNELRVVPFRLTLSSALPELRKETSFIDGDLIKISKRICINLNQCFLERNTLDIGYQIKSIVMRFQYLKLMDYFEAFQDQVLLSCKAIFAYCL